MAKKKVLFLCTNNSCRSQMAEGLLRHMAGEDFEVSSAGTHPTHVNEYAIKAMAEVGIDIAEQRSKSLGKFMDEDFDCVITVCDSARTLCPVFPGDGEKLHWDIPDPAGAGDTEEDILAGFRRVREMLAEKIKSTFCG
ncbi:MAG: arsenate reductase ArsC [Phycisphaerae bacterium]|nr:arsenate reductase ArsC [Phycisphaerae bacterium]